MAGGILLIVLGAVIIYAIIARANEAQQEYTSTVSSNRRTLYSASSKAEESGFKTSRSLMEREGLFGIAIDQDHKRWMVTTSESYKPTCYNFSDLISYEIVDDGIDVVSSNAGNAAIGGILFGTVGAIAGASAKREISKTCDDLHIDITVNDLQNPHIVLPLIKGKYDRSSEAYRAKADFAKDIASLLAYIKANSTAQPAIDTQQKIEPPHEHDSAGIYDELERLHALKEKGIITEEEFQKKKESLLGI